MPELVIQGVKDIEKLAGWTILEATMALVNGNPGIKLKLSHPAAACHVQVILYAHTTLVLSGDTVKAVANITIRSSDSA